MPVVLSDMPLAQVTGWHERAGGGNKTANVSSRSSRFRQERRIGPGPSLAFPFTRASQVPVGETPLQGAESRFCPGLKGAILDKRFERAGLIVLRFCPFVAQQIPKPFRICWWTVPVAVNTTLTTKRSAGGARLYSLCRLHQRSPRVPIGACLHGVGGCLYCCWLPPSSLLPASCPVP